MLMQKMLMLSKSKAMVILCKDPKVEENLSSTNFETTERRWRINAVPRAATDFAWQLKTEILTNVAKIMALTWMNGVNLN